jgi:hypothetical protein
LLGILLDGGGVTIVEAATAEDADTVVVVKGADTEINTMDDIKKHKFMCWIRGPGSSVVVYPQQPTPRAHM